MTTERIVVGIKQVDRDWLDVEGHYWKWDEAAQIWRHDREQCQITYVQNCHGRPQ